MKIYWFDSSYEKNIRLWLEDQDATKVEFGTRCNDLQIGASIKDEDFQAVFEARWGRWSVDQTAKWEVNGQA